MAKNFSVNEADLDLDSGVMRITYAQNTHADYARAAGRISSILDQIYPEEIKTLKLVNLNADMALNEITISRDKFNRFENIPVKDLILNKDTVKHRDGSVSKYIQDLDNNKIELIKYEKDNS